MSDIKFRIDVLEQLNIITERVDAIDDLMEDKFEIGYANMKTIMHAALDKLDQRISKGWESDRRFVDYVQKKIDALEQVVEKLEAGNKSAKACCGEQIKINDISREYFRSNENRIIALEDKLNAFLEAYKMVNSEREHNGCNYSIDMEGFINKSEPDYPPWSPEYVEEEQEAIYKCGLCGSYQIIEGSKEDLEENELLDEAIELKEVDEQGLLPTPEYISVEEHERILNRVVYDERVKFFKDLNNIEHRSTEGYEISNIKEKWDKMIKFYEELEKDDNDEINELFEDDHMGNTGGEERIGRSL